MSGRTRSPHRTLGPGITIRGAFAHNLRSLGVEIPGGGLIAVTGMSGSGKSSLVFDVLAPSVERVLASVRSDSSARDSPARVSPHGEHLTSAAAAPVNCGALILHAPFRGVARVEQALPGFSPWSNPATHTGLLEQLRSLFARTEAAATRGLRKQHFSTLTRGGRCEACEGLGQTRISMDFLPDVWTICEDCGGTCVGADVLACTIDGRSIADVLGMSIDEVRAFFADHDRIAAPLDVLRDVGLGYVRLGQPVRTLSGGERQRLVLATALLERAQGPRLYLFDEPTKGLHGDDVEQLVAVFDRLVDAGHTLVAVEHSLDLIARADWVIDLGPEGGAGGGLLVAAGPPAAIAARPASHTGRALARAGLR